MRVSVKEKRSERDRVEGDDRAGALLKVQLLVFVLGEFHRRYSTFNFSISYF